MGLFLVKRAAVGQPGEDEEEFVEDKSENDGDGGDGESRDKHDNCGGPEEKGHD